MRSREEFGKYLLLKKLTEDPLGETFRAGRVGGDGVEQVVLLRVFNGSAVDGAALARSLEERSELQEKLKNPNIGSGVDLGEERGVPFVAYDYISGRNLETLLIQASNTNSPIPADHAMLIAERMSLALSVAAESRLGDQRLIHGFAVPHLVMISNEGETRVLGFEASAGLAAQAGGFDAQITRYLAPEVVGGQTAERSDDVFTLGAVLFELLACQPLPSPAADGTYEDAIAGAQVAYDGNPFPAPVVDLLRRSLAPRGQRLASAGDWHKALSGLMVDAGHAATTFNLAFFMHNLFRNEIEQESQEIEEEKTMSLTAAELGLEPEDTEAPEETPAAGVEAPATVGTVEEEETKGSNKALIGALAAVILVALAVGGWFLFGPGLGSDAGDPEPQTTQAPPPQLPEEPEPEPEPQGPTPEEIQAQLAEMIDTRSEEMESKLRQQYDERIRRLQADLREAQTAAAEAAAERERQRLEAERRAEEEAARQAAAQEAAEEAARQAEEETQDQEQARADDPGDASATDGAGSEAAAGAGGRQAQQQRSAPPEPEPEPEPAVREGDLVSPGPGVRPPELIVPPETRYPAMAKKLAKEANVEVRVLVDERGNVRTAELVGDGKAGFGFDQAALEAARSARFRPAQKDGVRVKMYFNLTIRFEL